MHGRKDEDDKYNNSVLQSCNHNKTKHKLISVDGLCTEFRENVAGFWTRV